MVSSLILNILSQRRRLNKKLFDVRCMCICILSVNRNTFWAYAICDKFSHAFDTRAGKEKWDKHFDMEPNSTVKWLNFQIKLWNCCTYICVRSGWQRNIERWFLTSFGCEAMYKMYQEFSIRLWFKTKNAYRKNKIWNAHRWIND